MPRELLSYLFSRRSSVRLSLPLSGQELAWMWKWRRACQLDACCANRARPRRLAFYSRHRLHVLSARHQPDYGRSRVYMGAASL